ncbi:RNASET2 (predicted) [Pycnogonum litorale]
MYLFTSQCSFRLQLFVWIIGISCFCVYYADTYSVDDTSWDSLVFTQIWPGSKCLHLPYCHVPAGIKNWTIHGLWPDKRGTMGPFFCNSSWHFDDAVIKDLIPDMKTKWPNYYTNEPFDSLWKHEWTKHGTCASSLPTLYGEKKYFERSLKLSDEYNMFKLLQESGIKPEEMTSYSAEEILGKLQQLIGHKVVIQCESDEGSSMLVQVEICFDKQFNTIDCKGHDSCKKEVKYPPIKKNNNFNRGSLSTQQHHTFVGKLLGILRMLNFFSRLT